MKCGWKVIKVEKEMAITIVPNPLCLPLKRYILDFTGTRKDNHMKYKNIIFLLQTLK